MKASEHFLNRTVHQPAFRFFSFSRRSTCPYFDLLCFYFLNYIVYPLTQLPLDDSTQKFYCKISSFNYHLKGVFSGYRTSESRLFFPSALKLSFHFLPTTQGCVSCQLQSSPPLWRRHLFDPLLSVFSTLFQHVLSIFLLGGFFFSFFLLSRRTIFWCLYRFNADDLILTYHAEYTFSPM